MKAANRKPVVKFGQFELDPSEERLLKKGLLVRIENQPLQILCALLDHPGEMVSREELCSRLWPDGTYVAFDEGLNTAVKKLRYALGDAAENPVFIDTVPRRGYRFIAPVQIADVSAGQETAVPENGNGHSSSASQMPVPPIATAGDFKSRARSFRLIALGVTLLGIFGLIYALTVPQSIRVTQITRLTHSGRSDAWGRLASDGSRLFFMEREADHWNDLQVSVAGGESIPFGPAGRNIRIHSLSPDQSEILFSPFVARTEDLPLWSMPLVGGSPHRVGEILANGAAYSRDGTRIAFANNAGVFVANRDGSGVRQVANVPDCWSVAWSPDGKVLRFDAHPSQLWQVSSSGQDLHPFLPSWNAWDGQWTFDGSYYIFSANKNGWNALWALRESPSLALGKPVPVQITSTPIAFSNSLPARDGHTIYSYGGLGEEFDLVRYEPATHRFQPVSPGVKVIEAAFSPDRHWVLYNDWHELWRSRADGSDRLRLAGAPAIPGIHYARWSPDSKQIVFGNEVGNNLEIFLMSADGGAPRRLVPTDVAARMPTWSPDGQTISFSVPSQSSSWKPGVYLFDLARGASTRIPGSDGLGDTSWSPDGHFLAATSENLVKLFDLRTRRWTEVGHGTLVPLVVWSPDSALYFQDLLAPGEPVYRVRPGVSGQERIYSFEDILQAGAMRCSFEGFAPDGSLLVRTSRGGGDVYALTIATR